VKGESYAEVIRRLVRRPDIEAAPRLPADEGRLVSAVAQALRARARRRALVRRVRVATFAAAAAVALGAGVHSWQGLGTPGGAEGPPVASAQGPHALTVLAAEGGAADGASAPLALKRGMPVGVGLTLRAPASGPVRVGTADGTSLALEAGGELTVTEAGATQRFALKSGAVSARVSRLFAGERFIVDTRDAEVEVHGTQFRVSVVPGDPGCADGATTRVSVLEGVVRVRAGGREVSVPAGGVWPSGCEATEARAERTGERPRARVTHLHAARAITDAPAPPAPAEAPAAAAPAAPLPVAIPAPAAPLPVESRPVAASPAPESSLGAENDLFASAVRAKKQGRPEEAARLFGELAASHPGSPLVESALVQRMKLLATVDPAAGARAAAAYLERFPAGFARPEAQALVDRSAP
jgi:hypothetical protein